MKTKLLLLDLDKTLLTKDSSFLFIKEYYNLHILVHSFLRKIRIKSKFSFYSNLTLECEKILSDKKLKFFLEKLMQIVDDKVLEFANIKKSDGYKVVVVTSSPQIYVKPLIDSFHFDSISSRHEGNSFIFVHDIEKYNQLKHKYPISKFDYSIGISDNDSDLIFSQHFKNWIKYEPNNVKFNMEDFFSKTVGSSK